MNFTDEQLRQFLKTLVHNQLLQLQVHKVQMDQLAELCVDGHGDTIDEIRRALHAQVIEQESACARVELLLREPIDTIRREVESHPQLGPWLREWSNQAPDGRVEGNLFTFPKGEKG